MRHLDKIKPGGRPLAIALPEGRGFNYPLHGTYFPHFEDFDGTALDTDEWATDHSLGTAGASFAVASSLATLDTSTGTVGTATVRFRSATSSNAHILNVPFRVTWLASISVTAGAGLAPTGGLNAYLGVYNSGRNGVGDDTHYARFNFDLTTAGSSSMASPVIELEVRAGSTVAGDIASAAHNIFLSTASRTATGLYGYTIEARHDGVWFGVSEDINTLTPPRCLSFFGRPPLLIDQNYYIDTRIVANGTAGFTQSDGVQLIVNAIKYEQLAPVWDGWVDRNEQFGNVRSTYHLSATPTEAGSLVTSGAGILLGMAYTTTSTAAVDAWVAFYDVSAAGTGCYDYAADDSAQSKIIWVEQVEAAGSTPQDVMYPPKHFPVEGIPFYRGLVVGGVDFDASGEAAASAFNVLVVRKSFRP